MGRLIIDTSGYLAGTAVKHPQSEVTRGIIRAAAEPPVVSPLVLAEIADLDVDDVRAARGLAVRYHDLRIGITDGLNAVLADRYDTNEILTTDQRHFRVLTPLSRKFDAFRLLPADL